MVLRIVTFALMFALAAAVWAAPQVKLQTSMGDVVLELNAEQAPLSTANFLNYVRSGFYDGTIFHRVIKTFMIQGGGYSVDYQRKETAAPIQNEADNGLKNARGTIAMARTRDPHSASAQFFINVVDNDFLNHTAPNARGWGYAVFGKVIAGMEVVDAIRAVPTGAGGPFGQDAPQTPVVIEAATIISE